MVTVTVYILLGYIYKDVWPIWSWSQFPCDGSQKTVIMNVLHVLQNNLGLLPSSMGRLF